MTKFGANLKYWWDEHKDDVLDALLKLTMPIWIIPVLLLLLTGDNEIDAYDKYWLMAHGIPYDQNTTKQDFRRLKKEYKNKKINEYISTKK